MPIARYSNITSFAPAVIEFEFTESDHLMAQVALIEYQDDNDEVEEPQGTYIIEVDGDSYADAFLIDPRSLDESGTIWLFTNCEVTLDEGVPYLLVVYIETGETWVDFPACVTITFERIQ